MHDNMARKILIVRQWWPTLMKDVEIYAKSCNICQRVRKLRDVHHQPLLPVLALGHFEKWVLDFIGPINPIAKRTQASMIHTSGQTITKL